MQDVSPQVRLAMAAVQAYVAEGRMPNVPEWCPQDLLSTRAGAFVCLKVEGHLRGCIGTIEPTQDSLAAEIQSNAISAATRDPRFMPVQSDELPALSFSVDVLGEPELIKNLEELDPIRYGVIVQNGSRRGLLLPDLDGVDTAEQQVDIARRKACIGHHEKCELYRFEVIRYE